LFETQQHGLHQHGVSNPAGADDEDSVHDVFGGRAG
jgi:hypothetical protein